eukprot:235945-Prorocentrum_minimum.AAC.1
MWMLGAPTWTSGPPPGAEEGGAERPRVTESDPLGAENDPLRAREASSEGLLRELPKGELLEYVVLRAAERKRGEKKGREGLGAHQEGVGRGSGRESIDPNPSTGMDLDQYKSVPVLTDLYTRYNYYTRPSVVSVECRCRV